MTINDVLSYNRIIKSFIDNATDVNSLIKFKMLGMVKQFEPVVQNFNTIRDDLIGKYGEENEDGAIGIFEPKKENYESDKEFEDAMKKYGNTIKSFNEEIESIVNSEADIKINKFKAEEIMNAGIPSDYLVVLYDLIEE